MKIRKMSKLDLPDVVRIQQECYSSDLLESIDSFSAKLFAGPDFCFVAVQGSSVIGYAFALPWELGKTPQLNAPEYLIPSNADSLYIHDIAVSPTMRKLGAAKSLVGTVLDTAKQKRYKRLFLVAVQGASSYWARQGFETVPMDEVMQRELSAYGEGAIYMARTECDA